MASLPLCLHWPMVAHLRSTVSLTYMSVQVGGGGVSAARAIICARAETPDLQFERHGVNVLRSQLHTRTERTPDHIIVIPSGFQESIFQVPAHAI